MKHCLQLLLASLTIPFGCVIAAEPQKTQSTEMPRAPSDVFLSSPKYSFEVNFTPFYAQPTTSNLDYAAEAEPLDNAVPIPAISPNWIIHEVSPHYHFGFDVGIAGIFHGANSMLSLNWERFHSPNDTKSADVGEQNMIGPFFEIGPDASFYKKARGSIHFHFDEINLDYGTFVNFGNRLRMNLFSGVSFARILQHRFVKFSNTANDIVRTLKVPSRFIGAGPQFGIDCTYRIAKGFQFVGNSKASLFVGSFKNKTTFSTSSQALISAGGPNPNVQTTTITNRTGMVPGFEGKLGLAYDFEFSSHYMVKLEAGYQAQIYLNSIRSIDMGSEVALQDIGSSITGATGVYARTFQRTISDFALAGPYFTLDVGF